MVSYCCRTFLAITTFKVMATHKKHVNFVESLSESA